MYCVKYIRENEQWKQNWNDSNEIGGGKWRMTMTIHENNEYTKKIYTIFSI